MVIDTDSLYVDDIEILTPLDAPDFSTIRGTIRSYSDPDFKKYWNRFINLGYGNENDQN